MVKFFKELKNGIEILVGQVVCKLCIKNKKVNMLFSSITQEPLGLPKFWCYFGVPWTIFYKMGYVNFQEDVDD